MIVSAVTQTLARIAPALLPFLLTAADCSDLARVSIPNTTIVAAESLTSGVFEPKGVRPVRNLPQFCRVNAVLKPSSDSHIEIEVWMPEASKWNGKFQGIGNGGYAGAISFDALGVPLRAGFATASTDTGHKAKGGIDASWALNHPEKVIDFGYRAIHETTVTAKALIRAYYGQGPKRSYFSSCSNGGRQALMEAQRFPDDYDGIVAGAPANNWTGIMATMMAGVQATLGAPGSYIPHAKLAAIQAHAMKSCDSQDGLADGLVNDPAGCRPDPKALLCSGAETDSCLTAPQAEALSRLYGGVVNSKGKQLFPGFSPGGEAEQGGWQPWITGDAPQRSAMFGFVTQFFKNIVYVNPEWDFRSYRVDRDLKAAESKAAKLLNANNPDLRRFQARGGKLILYHGWSDAAIPGESATRYFRSVQRKMGARNTKGFMRLFMAPGVQHCGGGSGPNTFGQASSGGGDPERNVFAAIERWVENGIAPETIIATKYKAGTPGAVERTRPLCAYPKVAKYKGSGSVDDAASFDCEEPTR
jgi:feruloyl esterase